MACRDSTNFIAFISVSFRNPVHMKMVGSTVLRFLCLSPLSQDEPNIIKNYKRAEKSNARELMGVDHTRKCYLQIR